MSKTAIYRFFDADGVLLYVGITERFGQRWAHHARNKPWWDEVHSQTAEWHPERALAVEAEKNAIRTEKPKYNIVHRPKPAKTKPVSEKPAKVRERLPALSIPGYLTTKEVAAYLGVKPRTVNQYLWREEMPEPDERVGPLPLWKEETIEKWREQRASASWNRKK